MCTGVDLDALWTTYWLALAAMDAAPRGVNDDPEQFETAREEYFAARDALVSVGQRP